MLEAFAEGASLLSLEVLLFAFLGVVICQVIAVIPGLGGPFALAVLLPITFGLSSEAAIAMLVAAAVTSNTANSVTSIVFGVPGSPAGVATVFDGYPMARKGEASRALSASIISSLVGGIIGAVALAFAIPAVRPIALAIGPAEFFVLVVIAVILMGSIGQDDRRKGILSGLAGLGLALVGQEGGTGTLRYTYGSLYLWDGINVVAALIGLFALTEMLLLLRTRSGAIAQAEASVAVAGRQLLQGAADVFRYWKTTGLSSLSGTFIGMVPGLGGETAQFLAYSQASRISKTGHKFGTGEVEGVIAADAATNSKEGGALLATLALGIPGSTTMAILLIAFTIHDVVPGQRMLEGDGLGLTWMIILILIIANLIATVLVLSAIRPLSSLTFVKAPVIVAVVFLVAVFGAYAIRGQLGDVVVMFIFGFVGYAMAVNGYSRVTLVVGLVLGPILEHNLLLAWNIAGWGLVTRPWTLVLIGFALVLLLQPIVKRRLRNRSKSLDADLSWP